MTGTAVDLWLEPLFSQGSDCANMQPHAKVSLGKTLNPALHLRFPISARIWWMALVRLCRMLYSDYLCNRHPCTNVPLSTICSEHNDCIWFHSLQRGDVFSFSSPHMAEIKSNYVCNGSSSSSSVSTVGSWMWWRLQCASVSVPPF